jgi:hypothetical protein
MRRAILTLAALALSLGAVYFGLLGCWVVSGPCLWVAACLANTVNRTE